MHVQGLQRPTGSTGGEIRIAGRDDEHLGAGDQLGEDRVVPGQDDWYSASDSG